MKGRRQRERMTNDSIRDWKRQDGKWRQSHIRVAIPMKSRYYSAQIMRVLTATYAILVLLLLAGCGVHSGPATGSGGPSIPVLSEEGISVGMDASIVADPSAASGNDEQVETAVDVVADEDQTVIADESGASLDTALAMATSGEIVDAKTLVGLLLYDRLRSTSPS